MRNRIVGAFSLLMICTSFCFGNDDLVIRDAFLKKYPNAVVKSVTASPVEGLYEVVAGDNVFYFVPKTNHLIIGTIMDSNGKDLTAAVKIQLQAGKYEQFKNSLDKGIKIGSGKHEVIEVVDPDCSYCRKMASFWKERTDVTRYVFLISLPMHKQAQKKVDFIMSAKNPALVFEDVMAGKFDGMLPIINTNRKRVEEMAVLVEAAGVKGTPMYFINGQFVNGANTSKIKSVLGDL